MTTETVSLRENISPRTEKWIRISAVLAMIIVATSSAVLSFDGLKKVALDAQIPEHLAFLFPIAVDTTILMGSLAVLLYELFGVRAVFGWITVLFGTLLSIVGNVISVKDAGLIAQVLHGIIPVLLCISLESLLRILRFNIKRTRLARTSLPHLEPEYVADESPKGRESSAGKDSPVEETVEKSPEPAASLSYTPVTLEPETMKQEPATAIPEAVAEPVQPLPPTPDVVVPVKNIIPALPTPVADSLIKEEKPQATASEPAMASERIVAEPEKEPVAPVTVSESASKTPPAKRSPAKTTKGAKYSEENVSKYGVILSAFPEDTPKARKVAEILRAYPDASAADIKATLGDPPELRIDGTISRAREWLKKN